MVTFSYENLDISRGDKVVLSLPGKKRPIHGTVKNITNASGHDELWIDTRQGTITLRVVGLSQQHRRIDP